MYGEEDYNVNTSWRETAGGNQSSIYIPIFNQNGQKESLT